MSGSDSVFLKLSRHAGVTRVSAAESARIAALNPGPGLPLSSLDDEMQRRIRGGYSVTLEDLIESDQVSVQPAQASK